MVALPVTWVEVFATQDLMTGQLLPVIHDADGLATGRMQTLARRFRQPETSFVQSAEVADADYRNRFFTVGAEIPFAGHPSLGAAAAEAHRADRSAVEYVQQTGSGLQSLTVRWEGETAEVRITQNPHEYGSEVDPGPLLAALGIPADAAHPTLEARVVSTGLPALMLPLRSSRLLAGAAVDVAALRAAQPAGDGPIAVNCYVVAEIGPGRWKARMFTPDVPGGEDPATGSAVGPLGAYLHDRTGVSRITVSQGDEMGFPSLLEVEIDGGIHVTGRCRISATGEQRVGPDHGVRR